MKELIGIFIVGMIFTVLQEKMDMLLSKRMVFVIYSILFCILLYIYKNREEIKKTIV
jgi:hypothetical protein